MVLFADINQKTQDTMLDYNVFDDFILLSVENHDIQDFDEVEMFGLDFGGLFGEKLLEGEDEGLDGGVDFEEVDFGLELDGGAGELVELGVLDDDHEQKFGEVPLDNN